MSDIKSVGVLANIKEHIELYPKDSTMGSLLRDAGRLITSQGSLIAEANVLVDVYIKQERLHILRLQKQSDDIDNLKARIKRMKQTASRIKRAEIKARVKQ